MSAQLEDRVRLLESVMGETHAFATVALVIAEQAVGAALAGHDDPDAVLAALHERARDRIGPLAAKPENRAIAGRMDALLEAVLLHAAQTFSRKN